MPRNSSGTYSLPAGNPVVANTLIETAWANPTMSDIASAVTDSLDRYGRGAMLAPLKLTDGTVAAPALSFSSESTSGLYRASSNTLAIAIAGVLALSINATTMTVAKAAVFSSTATFSAASTFNAAATFNSPVTFSGGIGGVVPFALGAVGAPSITFTGDLNTGMWSPGADLLAMSTGGSERVRIDSNGNVGVNCTATSFAGYATVEAKGRTGAGGGLFFATSADGLVKGQFYSVGSDGTYFGTATSHPLKLVTNDVERMRIDASGNVGINGTPAKKLHTFGSIRQQNLVDGADTISLVDAGGTLRGNFYCSSTYLELDSVSAVPLVFGTNGAERVRIDANGDVGIGGIPNHYAGYTALTLSNNTNGSVLDLNVGGARIGSLFATSGEVRMTAFTAIPLTLFTANIERMRINASGGVELRAVAGTFLTLTDTTNGKTGYVNWNNDSLIFYRTGPIESMRIDASGNVGIGLTPIGDSAGYGGKTIEIAGPVYARQSTDTSKYLSLGVSGGVSWIEANGTANQIAFLTTAVERFRIDSAGRLQTQAIHNNASGASGGQFIASGTFTPGFTNLLNISSSTPGPAKWIRVGDVVTVSGSAVVTTTSGAGSSSTLRMALPIASTFTNAADCAGCATYGGGEGGIVQYGSLSTAADLQFFATFAGSRTFMYTYTYIVK